MIREIRIYVEGGGNDDYSRAELRKGFEEFLREIREEAGKQGIRVNVVTCGGRDSAYRLFCLAMKSKSPFFKVLLLVDSESTLKNDNPWQHFILDGKDDWGCADLDPNACHLMVQATEAWLIADSNKLSEFYGVGFRLDVLQSDNVEAISKYNLKNYLRNATQDSARGRYHKTQHAPILLGLIRPSIVREKASYCERLFSTLNDLIRN